MRWCELKKGDVFHYNNVADHGSYLVLASTFAFDRTHSFDLLNLNNGDVYNSWHVKIDQKIPPYVSVDLGAENQ